jgi:hypothetical protein
MFEPSYVSSTEHTPMLTDTDDMSRDDGSCDQAAILRRRCTSQQATPTPRDVSATPPWRTRNADSTDECCCTSSRDALCHCACPDQTDFRVQQSDIDSDSVCSCCECPCQPSHVVSAPLMTSLEPSNNAVFSVCQSTMSAEREFIERQSALQCTCGMAASSDVMSGTPTSSVPASKQVSSLCHVVHVTWCLSV